MNLKEKKGGRINETNTQLLEKINKMDKSIASLTRKQKIQITNIKNGKEDITKYPAGI